MDTEAQVALARMAFGAMSLALIGGVLLNARGHIHRRAFAFFAVAVAAFGVMTVARIAILGGEQDPTRSLRQVMEVVFGAGLGAVLLEHVRADRFRREELQGAVDEARQARLLAEKRARELEALSSVNAQMAASLDLRQVLQTVVDNALILSEADAALVFVRDRESGQLNHHGVGAVSKHLRSAELPTPRPNGVTESVAHSGEAVFVPDASQSAYYAGRTAMGLQAIASLPLRLEGEVLGVMNVSYLQPHVFSDDEGRMLAALADSSALAINNAMLHEQIASMAITDELTGLANRRRFVDALQLELVRAHRYQRPMAVMMIDVDDLKHANDHYGHAAGDAMLRSVAEALSGSLRKTDLPARLGGDEFAALLPETDADAALLIAARFRLAVSQQGQALKALEPLRQLDAAPDTPILALRSTVSIGVAAFEPDTPPDFPRLMHQADEALYRAKTGGGDQVVMA